MKYLFTYGYEAKDGHTGNGSIRIKATGTNRITEKMIYGKGGVIDIVKENLTDLFEIETVVPMGWFKFDEEDEPDGQ